MIEETWNLAKAIALMIWEIIKAIGIGLWNEPQLLGMICISAIAGIVITKIKRYN